MNRRSFLHTALAGTAAAALTTPLRALAADWPAIPAPVAPLIPHPIRQLGRERDDPFAWMKYRPATGTRTLKTLPAMLREHLTAEMRYADAMLAPLLPRRDALLARMEARASKGADDPGLSMGAWRYRRVTDGDGGHARYVRTPIAGGAEELLLDEAVRARGHAYYRTTEQQPSPNARFYVWAEDIVGNDRHRICVRDTVTGTVSIVVPADAYGYDGVTISPSSRWLFWIWRDARNRPTRLYRSAIAGGDAILVYEERDPAIFMAVRRTAADGFVALTLSGPDTSGVRLIPAADETATPRVVFPRAPGVRYEIDEWDGALLLLTDADGAIDRKLVALDPQTFAARKTLVPPRPGRALLQVLPFRDALLLLERVDGLHHLTLQRRDGSGREVPFASAAYALELPAGQDYGARAARVIYQAPDTPRQWIDVTLATGTTAVVARDEVQGFSPQAYRVERVFARTRDGETVPLTILSHRDTPRDGSAPLLLYGYGAYGISSEPDFSIPATVLVDQGWRYAIAHVRGGSEKGRRWFLEGRKFNKRNSFTDFVACADHLVANGYARRGGIVAYGLSAGGLLVAGAMNEAPDRFGGVIAKVPFVDMLNTMSDADHPLVPLFRPDWGDPLADPRAYDYIASISPYENVRAAPYPPLLCTAGLKDDRVAYWEPAKLVAQVRRRSTSGNPAILKLDVASGHQGSGNRHDEFGEMALFWAFADRCVSPPG